MSQHGMIMRENMFFLQQLQKLGRENLELTMRVLSAQAITTELADYSKRVLQQSAAMCEKLADTKTVDATIEVHTDHAKAAFEDLVSQSKRMGDLYQSFATESARSLKNALARCAVTRVEPTACVQPPVTDEQVMPAKPAVPIENGSSQDAAARAVNQLAEAAKHVIERG